jgi:hypothetical protein
MLRLHGLVEQTGKHYYYVFTALCWAVDRQWVNMDGCNTYQLDSHWKLQGRSNATCDQEVSKQQQDEKPTKRERAKNNPIEQDDD